MHASSVRQALAGFARQALVSVLAFSLVLPARALAVAAPSGGGAAQATSNRVERERYLDRLLAAIQSLRQSLDRSEFDTEALLESLDYDPEAVIDFVRDDIRFEPYSGLLRGAQGTLMSRAGNALDQSVLLASLLKEAGTDVRLGHAMLSDAQALAIVRSLHGQQTPAARTLEQQPGLRAAVETAMRAAGDAQFAAAIMQQVDDVRKPQETPLWAAAQAGSDYLQQHLRQAGIQLAPADAEPQLAAQVRAYYWVEYKDGVSAPWTRVHVLPAGDDLDEQALPTQEYLAEDIPERLQHRLRLTAKLERQVAGKTEVVTIMAPWERPVANMIGKRLTFSNQPNGIRSHQDLLDLSAIEARTTLLIPSFNDVPAPGAQAFDFRGRTISLDALKMDGFGAADLFQTLSDQSLKASDALAGLSFGPSGDTPKASQHSLSRVWLEYTSIHPDGTERLDERTIWQAEPMSQAAPAMLWELAVPHGIGVAVSTYPQSYLLDAELARFQAMEPLLRWTLASLSVPAGQAAPRMPRVDSAWTGAPELAYLSQFDAGIDTSQGALLAYRAEPSIVVTRQKLRNHEGRVSGRADVDIIHNRRRVLQTDASSVRTAPLQALRLGAWDTLVEEDVLAQQYPLLSRKGPAAGVSPNRMYRNAKRGDQAPLMLQRMEDLAALASTSLPDPTRLALEEDLKRGYVVALEPPRPSEIAVWWRIDPQTGEALGRGQDGRGQSLSEEAILTIIGIKTAMVAGTAICSGTTNCSVAQCMASTAITMTGVAAVGGVLGLAGSIGMLLAAGVGVVTHTGLSHIMPKEMQIDACHWES